MAFKMTPEYKEYLKTFDPKEPNPDSPVSQLLKRNQARGRTDSGPRSHSPGSRPFEDPFLVDQVQITGPKPVITDLPK